MDYPWVVMGDFNILLHLKDKMGGNLLPPLGLLNFKECINNFILLELPNIDLKYTWNNQQFDTPIFSRIDRVLCNLAWLEFQPSSYYHVAPLLSSDHYPLITFSHKKELISSRFMFKSYWPSLPSFNDILHKTWSSYILVDPFMFFFKKTHGL